MVSPGTGSDREADPSPGSALPLFRAEAIAAQQQKFYGDIILIHPFSLAFLTALAVLAVSIGFGFLVLGHYTQVAHVSGMLTAERSSGDRRLANLYVPARAIPFVHPGENLWLRCSACTPDRQRGAVREISTSPLQPAEIASESGIRSVQPLYRVTVALLHNNPLPSPAEIEADLPLQRKPLLQWLFERPAS